ncbi:MAG: ABC transporter ATP-binding protein, partial [Oscillospiraceae bacterium]
GAVFILYFGAKNVMGTGWCLWDIASFTTFLSCFSKMALKSSKVAKLFNAVQKARVSWQRINPLMRGFVELETQSSIDRTQPAQLQVTNLSVAYDHKVPVIRGLSFSAHAGEIIGITGPIACGKSTFGKVLLCETPYSGSVKIGQRELSTLSDYERSLLISYMGHQPELISDTLEENICLGDQGTALPYLNAVCMTDEVSMMPLGIQTFVGNGGIQLSGGQQARAALARALYHKQGILVLDDPFSAVDLITEQSIIEHLRCMTGDCVTLILSHRLSHFPEFDRVVLINDGNCQVGTHASLMDDCLEYASLYLTQMAGGNAHGS